MRIINDGKNQHISNRNTQWKTAQLWDQLKIILVIRVSTSTISFNHELKSIGETRQMRITELSHLISVTNLRELNGLVAE